MILLIHELSWLGACDSSSIQFFTCTATIIIRGRFGHSSSIQATNQPCIHDSFHIQTYSFLHMSLSSRKFGVEALVPFRGSSSYRKLAKHRSSLESRSQAKELHIIMHARRGHPFLTLCGGGGGLVSRY